MIKLFWNTHNQKTEYKDKTNSKGAVDYKWGAYHKKNSNIWIYDILKNIKFDEIESENNLESEDTLIIVDSSVEEKSEFYTKLRLICSKFFLIHLGDETGIYDLSKIYDNFNFVWRSFCLNKYFNNKKVSCIPLGYKSGTFLHNQTNKRKYKWAFIGTPHKSSRHDLLFQLSDIKPSFCHSTKKFNEKIIDVKEMSEILSSTKFLPCPSGFVHPDSYRIYEALECGCIPIVENAYKYYDRMFPNNPFLKVDKWIEAKFIIKQWNSEKISKKHQECTKWWRNYKKQLQEFIKNKVGS